MDRAGPGGLAYKGAIILTEGSIRFLSTSSYVPPIPYIRTLPDARWKPLDRATVEVLVGGKV